MTKSKSDLFFGSDDVIDDVINTKNYTDLAKSKIHIPIKFGVDCSNCATCIVTITDKQGKKQTDERAIEIAYLPKFANIILIVLVIGITEILQIILMFDWFENQQDCMYWLMMLMLFTPLYPFYLSCDLVP